MIVLKNASDVNLIMVDNVWRNLGRIVLLIPFYRTKLQVDQTDERN